MLPRGLGPATPNARSPRSVTAGRSHEDLKIAVAVGFITLSLARAEQIQSSYGRKRSAVTGEGLKSSGVAVTQIRDTIPLLTFVRKVRTHGR